MGAGFNVVARGATEADIYIYEPIGGWLGGVSAKEFADALKPLRSVGTLNVRINSEGGDVFDGVAIYNQLAQHPARIITHIDGLAASIASVVAMAGETIRIAESAFVMVHNPASGVLGTAEDMRRQADILDTVRGSMIDVYVERTRQSREQVEAWMNAETWMTGDEALKNGFADEMITNLRVAARLDPGRHGYRNAPAALLGLGDVAEPAAPVAPPATPQRPKAEAAARLAALMANRRPQQTSAA